MRDLIHHRESHNPTYDIQRICSRNDQLLSRWDKGSGSTINATKKTRAKLQIRGCSCTSNSRLIHIGCHSSARHRTMFDVPIEVNREGTKSNSVSEDGGGEAMINAWIIEKKAGIYVIQVLVVRPRASAKRLRFVQMRWGELPPQHALCPCLFTLTFLLTPRAPRRQYTYPPINKICNVELN